MNSRFTFPLCLITVSLEAVIDRAGESCASAVTRAVVVFLVFVKIDTRRIEATAENRLASSIGHKNRVAGVGISLCVVYFAAFEKGTESY